MSKVKIILSILMPLLFFSINSAHAITDSRDIKEIGIDEKLGDILPDNIILSDENNSKAEFGQLLAKDKPTVLSLVYYSCPRLCNFASDGLLQVINEMNSLSLGEDFKVLTVSFDPEDSTDIAKSKAVKYRSSTQRGEASEENWEFLTGDAENIKKLTESVGFRYKKDGEEFAHASALIILTPEGKISRYLHGIQHEPSDFRLSLIEASEGRVGSSRVINKVLLFCYGFDPIGKRYALKALNIVKAAGVVTLFTLCGVLAYFWRKERK
ncbi:MAG: SCO family protein [Deltaproteobacteria bacterium]